MLSIRERRLVDNRLRLFLQFRNGLAASVTKGIAAVLFECPVPTDREVEVIEQITAIRQATSHILAPTRRWLRPLRRTAFARNIQASNSIEGHHVSLDDALAAASDGIPDEATPTTSSP